MEKVYTIVELKKVSSEGYENAYQNYYNCECEYGYSWSDFAFSSVKAFLKLFDCVLCEFAIGGYLNEYSYDESFICLYNDEKKCEENLELSDIHGEILNKYLQLAHGKTLNEWDSCPLTGYCLDITLLEPFHEYMNGERYQDYTLGDLIDLSLSKALNETNEDYQRQLDYEGFEERCHANDYLFDIDGNLHK